MVREVHEETGLRVEETGLAAVDSLATSSTKQDFHAVRIIYHTRVLGGHLTNEIDGTTDLCQWWAIDELASIDRVDLAKLGCKLAFERSDSTR